VSPENPQPPFDEEAALAELDKLREDIQAARRQREQKVEEFETWMRDTRNTARVERITAIEQETRNAPPAAAARAATRASEPAAHASGLAAAPAAPAASKYAPLAEDEFPFEAPRVHSFPPIDRRWLYYAGGLAALVVVALLLGQMWGNRTADAPPSTAEAQTGQPPSAAGTSAQVAQTAAPPAAPAPRKPVEIELTTTRPVWIRVTVDGEKRVEREVPAGQRLAFGADKVIVLRAGDGGGVRLSVGGRDQGLLGRDGQIAVRTFTK
jgi:hypothetical protein